ncbi:MAG: hypothetical protein K5985_06985 [Lachnospiraceae bacterium]|nr:hypothetical protein [Lachnospiraceae bacterium]
MNAPALTEVLRFLTALAPLREAAVMFLLYLSGGVFLFSLGLRRLPGFLLSLAFPAGLSLFTLTGFLCLVSGLPFTGLSVSLLIFLALCAALFFGPGKKETGAVRSLLLNKKYLLIFLALGAAAVCFSVCRLLPVTIDNDSVYYYSVYPETLVREGRFLASFDTFLTDVGPLSAVLNCLPFFFGFDNTIGVQTLMNLSFLGAFAAFMFRELSSSGTEKKEARLFSVLALFFLLGSMPFRFISSWIMSNAYFMELFFICVLLGYRSFGVEDRENTGLFAALLLFLAMCSLLRVEGSVMTVLAVASFSLVPENSGRKLMAETLAAALTPLLFYLMLYIRLGVDPLYSFLDLKKAVLTLGLFILLALWILTLRKRLSESERLFSFLPAALLLLLIAGNLGLALINKERYISNLKTFYTNIRLGNGWGIFGLFFVLCVLWSLFDLVRAGFRSPDFFDFFFPALLLTIAAACWARGGLLRVGVGDSGNRVLMQTVPFVVLILVRKAGRRSRAPGDI